MTYYSPIHILKCKCCGWIEVGEDTVSAPKADCICQLHKANVDTLFEMIMKGYIDEYRVDLSPSMDLQKFVDQLSS